MNAMPAAPKAQRLPETMNLREIGAHMAGLRAGFGLSQQEVSERLHIRTRYISAIEEGKLDLLPGKVYARGYVHTYAEFLGLDADQAVELCFAGEAPANVQKPAAKTSSVPSVAASQWRGYSILAVIGLLLLLVITQISGKMGDADEKEAAVEAVPEDMLLSVRTMVMPTSGNYRCLTKDSVLDCFYADHMTQALAQLDTATPLLFAGDIDVSGMAIPMTVEEEVPLAEGAETNTAPSEPVPEEAAPEPAND